MRQGRPLGYTSRDRQTDRQASTTREDQLMHEYTGYTETTSSGWTAGLLLAALALAVLWLGVSAAANASPDLTFRTTDAEHQHHNNKAVVQVSPADPDSYDRAETGPMYRVVFIDGTVLHAFADELHGTGAERLR